MYVCAARVRVGCQRQHHQLMPAAKMMMQALPECITLRLLLWSLLQCLSRQQPAQQRLADPSWAGNKHFERAPACCLHVTDIG
jgi:type IV secretory pathway VirD2 relaxase